MLLPDVFYVLSVPENLKLKKHYIFGFPEDEESGEDDADVPNRAAIKKQSQFIIDSKTKRRVPKKKKKTK